MEKLKLYLLLLILHPLTAKSLSILIITVMYYKHGMNNIYAESVQEIPPQENTSDPTLKSKIAAFLEENEGLLILVPFIILGILSNNGIIPPPPLDF